MAFMTVIINRLNDAAAWFYELYLNFYGWVYPFSEVAPFLYLLSQVFNHLAWAFYDFSTWVSEVQGKVLQILSWDTIWSNILGVVPNLSQIRDWFYGWVTHVTGVITTWWSSASLTVLVWVQDAKNLATALFNQVNALVVSLKESWDSFKGKIPSIDAIIAWWGNWTGNVTQVITTWWSGALREVQGLIDSAFVARASLWTGWQDMRGQVFEFLTDPLEFLWNRFADWFLGPEV